MNESKSDEVVKPNDDAKTFNEITELKNSLQHLQAEFENYIKRSKREKEDFIKNSEKDIVHKMLPVLDNLELALSNTTQDDDFVKGIKLIYSQFVDILTEAGLVKIEAMGKKFDPYLFEALLHEQTDQEDEIVIEELQNGYTFHGKVLRHAKVKINKKKRNDNQGNTDKKDP